MTVESALQKQLTVAFNALNSIGASDAFPAPGSLSDQLEKLMPHNVKPPTSVNVGPNVLTLFATAAVDMWLRAVHSFLISASLTVASPIWASVSGYYSSHYAVRALAHLLGYCQLFRTKMLVRVEIAGGRYVCFFDAKHGRDREHRFYWTSVKRNIHFAADPLFTENDSTVDSSDVAHRDRANYADHMQQCPGFRELSLAELKARIDMISEIEFTAPPIPRRSKFPDIENVQIVAYHRIVRFRQFLDEVLGGANRFWTRHRSPGWTLGIITFQLTEQGGLRIPGN